MKRIYLLFACVALATGQKHHKGGKHAKHAYVAAAPGGGGGGGQSGESYEGPSSYESPAPYKNHHFANPNAKHAYPQLLADTRTLNHDGTINFNFQADNGLQQGETVDADGTRRGYYSYPGADGKMITVKYSAGKHGFIAEGDHLPLQPQSAQHSDKDGNDYSPKHVGREQEYDDGQYRPGTYDTPSPPRAFHGGHAPAKPHRPAASFSYNPSSGRGEQEYDDGQYRPGTYSSGFEDDGFPQGFSSSPPRPHFNHNAAPSRPAAAPAVHRGQGGKKFHSGGGPSSSFASFGGPAFGGPNASPVHYASSSHGGSGFTADNPFHSSGAGPYSGKFDLGNNGHFSIDFAPGASQEFAPGGGQASIPQPFRVSQFPGPRPRPVGPRAPVSGTRGQY